jgi:hypothetical protein
MLEHSSLLSYGKVQINLKAVTVLARVLQVQYALKLLLECHGSRT